MKIFIMTDLEGVAGVTNRQDWVFPDSRYYEIGKELLSKEVNAAVEGFFEAGADEIYVIDGHGAGGLDHLILDSRTYYVKGFPDPWPFTLDKTFDAIAWIGQHAKASTEFAHIAHTGNHHVIDCRINGVSVGEFGQLSMCAAFLGVRSIFLSGDEAAAKEAQEFVGGIETVSVKRGLMPGSGKECTFDEYKNRNIAAIHLHPQKAGEMIRNSAKKALERFVNDKGSFELKELKGPFKMVKEFRPDNGRTAYLQTWEHADDIIKMLNSKEKVI